MHQATAIQYSCNYDTHDYTYTKVRAPTLCKARRHCGILSGKLRRIVPDHHFTTEYYGGRRARTDNAINETRGKAQGWISGMICGFHPEYQPDTIERLGLMAPNVGATNYHQSILIEQVF